MAYAEPDTKIEYVAPAGTCAAPAPVTEHSRTAADAAPDTVIEYVALAGICAAPAPAYVTETWRDADMSESMSEMSEDAAVNDDGLLDTVFDAICELGRQALLGACAPDSGADLLAAGAIGETTRRMGVYGSHLQGGHETRGGILPVGCRTNREVQADLNDRDRHGLGARWHKGPVCPCLSVRAVQSDFF